MSEHEKLISLLFTAELQFRLATAVRLAATLKAQPLDLPMEWTHGQSIVKYEEIALRQDQADYAACFLHRSATFLMAVAIKDAIRAIVPDPKSSTDSNVRSSYQVARLIRNAFAHAPFKPIWSIDPDCRDKVFTIPNVVTLDTTGLHGTPFDWRHYGGPLALFRLCRFVRMDILKDKPKSRKDVPIPNSRIYQQGNLILKQVDQFTPDGLLTKIERLPDGGIPLGDGHILYPDAREQKSENNTAQQKNGADGTVVP